MVLTTVVAKKMELSMSQLDVFSAALETPTWCDRRTSSSSAVNDVLCTHVLFSGHSVTYKQINGRRQRRVSEVIDAELTAGRWVMGQIG